MAAYDVHQRALLIEFLDSRETSTVQTQRKNTDSIFLISKRYHDSELKHFGLKELVQ
ncbi:hypothetical protein NPIL_30731, partial [Nephila pilipes]